MFTIENRRTPLLCFRFSEGEMTGNKKAAQVSREDATQKYFLRSGKRFTFSLRKRKKGSPTTRALKKWFQRLSPLPLRGHSSKAGKQQWIRFT
jgi:hypothetical protein